MLEDFYKSDWQVNTVDYQSFPKGIGTFIGLLLITIERLYEVVESLFEYQMKLVPILY